MFHPNLLCPFSHLMPFWLINIPADSFRTIPIVIIFSFNHFQIFLAIFSIISKCPVLVFPVTEFHLFFSRYLFPIFFDILMGQKWHTNVHAKFLVFPNFKPHFLIIFKCSGQRFMFFFLKLDAFFSIFCKVSCHFWSSFSKF